jgi:phospholipase C
MAIQHLVVLMMENRSFDHMLGFMMAPDYKINGVDGSQTNPSASGGPPVHVTSDAQPVGDLDPDPGHEFLEVNVQIFGNEQAKPPTGPLMQGFIQAYADESGKPAHAAKIMKCFSPAGLPVLSTLARHFAVCDKWYSSVPGPTSPNRAFAHAATSMGSVLSDFWWFHLKTIYEVLDKNKVSYTIYRHPGETLLEGVEYLINHQNGFRDHQNFARDCANGDLPQYTFIEPRYSLDGLYPPDDQHPNWDVRDGEDLIRAVYEAIRGNQTLWDTTLLLIVYDEHGGIFDHVAPPAIAPSGDVSQHPPFRFDRLGVRVPAVLVSPYICAGTIDSTLYEHSSIVATIRELFLPKGTPPLTSRDAAASTFLRTLLLSDPPRTDKVQFPGHNLMAMTPARQAVIAATPPTSLVRTMMLNAQHALDQLGLEVEQRAESVTTQQHATAFFRRAHAALATVAGRAK